MLSLHAEKTTCPADGIEAAQHFVEHLFPDSGQGLLEIRYFTQNGPRQDWFSLDRRLAFAARAVELSHQHETYFGVAVRKGRKGDKAGVAYLTTLFADLDFERFEGGGIEALERLDAFKPAPTAAVWTGGGMHCFWRLREPLYPTTKTQAILRSLIRSVGGDPGAKDISRVLRLPGCWSHKRQVATRLLRCLCTS